MTKHMANFFKTYWVSSAVSILSILYVAITMDFSALLVALILIALEVTFSFDNAVVNAKKLKHMSPAWQKLFLTVGIFIAIFGMRIIFPIAIVVFTAGISWGEVVNLALNNPELYAKKLEIAHPVISAFGGSFLLMLALHFFFDHKKSVHWFRLTEIPATKLGLWWVPPIIATITMFILSRLPFNHYPSQTLKAGIAGIIVYSAIHGLTWFLAKGQSGNGGKAGQLVGWAAFSMFIYLEILDASFSFDGVLGAFAITKNLILIAIGLGVGAIWVRSLTVFMVRNGTLEAFEYLEHGAHYAIGFLAGAMLTSLFVAVPEVITGLTGVVLIGLSIHSSVRLRKKHLL